MVGTPSPPPPVVRCGSGFGSAWSPAPTLWCGVVRGSGRPGCFEIVVIFFIIIIIIMIVIVIGILIIIIIMMFLSWVHCHRKWARHERLLVTVAFSIPSWQSPGWKVSIVTRIGCVWDEILMTVDGFGAAMWEKYAWSQGFGIFGPGRAGGGGGGAGMGGPRTGIIYV